MMRLELPKGHEESVFVASVSGGKDSTATILALRESGIHFRAVFADTAWEDDIVYEYLDTLERLLGITIDRVAYMPGGMHSLVRLRAGFPSRKARFCTEILKRRPIVDYHESVRELTGLDTVAVTGVRAEESPARAALPVFNFDEDWDSYTWRPILHWTIDDVLRMHHRHGVPINPLYRTGFPRVGCRLCIMAQKGTIRLTAQHDPEAIEIIREWEAYTTEERGRRNEIAPGRYEWDQATYFLAKIRPKGKKGQPEPFKPMPIDDIVGWSRTSRGGRQIELAPQPSDGCFKWGLCEPPANDNAKGGAL